MPHTTTARFCKVRVAETVRELGHDALLSIIRPRFIENLRVIEL